MNQLPSQGAGNASPDSTAAIVASLNARWYLWAIFAVTVAGAVLRAVKLAHPMRYDECWTFLCYVLSGTPGSLFLYDAPNNHVLHTLAVFVSSKIFGVAPWALRLPAFLAGVAVIPAGAHLARKLSGRPLAGVLTAMLLAGSSIMVEYCVNARGYSILCLATLVQATFVLSISRNVRDTRAWIGWTIAGALGVYAMPTMVFSIAVFAGALVLQTAISTNRQMLKPTLSRLVIFSLFTIGLAAVLYLPVFYFNGISAVIANPYTTPKPFLETISHNWTIAQDAFADWLRDTSWVWWIVAGAGLTASLAAAVRTRNAFLALPVAGPAIVLAVVLAQRVTPFPRTWLFMLPLILACVSAGLAWLVQRISAIRSARLVAVFVVVLVLVGAGQSALRTYERPYLISEDPATMVDAEDICKDVSESTDGQATIVAWSPGWPSIIYYWYIINHRMPEHRMSEQIFIAVGDHQTLDDVLAHYHQLRQSGRKIEPWHKEYPHARVYAVEPAMKRPVLGL